MLIKVKEYAKHVGKDESAVRRKMREGRLKVTRPPQKNPHYAMLIDSNQPWPEQRQARKLTSGQAGRESGKPTARVPVQSHKPDDKTSGNGWWEVVVVGFWIYVGECVGKAGR